MDTARGELETWGFFYMKEYIHDYQLVSLQNRGAHSSVEITLTNSQMAKQNKPHRYSPLK